MATFTKALRLFAILALCANLVAAGDDNQTLPLKVAVTKDGVSISEGDHQVLFYQSTPKSLDGRYERSGYVHPLYDLDGQVLTEDFPTDHRHHRGIFWAWHQVWVGDKPIGDPWAIKDFSWDVQNILVGGSEASSMGFTADVLWKSPLVRDEQGRPRALVRESSRISVHREENDARKIDFHIELLALVKDLRLGGSDDEKGYGGFSVRVQLPKDVKFTARDGEVQPQTGGIPAGPWMDISGTLSRDKLSGVTILCHPSLPGFPQPWILRGSHSMQNPAWPGRNAVPLSTETPLVLRYRLVIHRGLATREMIDAWQTQFANSP